MLKKILLGLLGSLTGALMGYYLAFAPKVLLPKSSVVVHTIISTHSEVIGFLPFWLTDKAMSDYPNYITNLTYFGLTLDTDGTILRSNEAGELDPGWYSLKNGKIDNFLAMARENNISLSLLIFNGNEESVEKVLEDPTRHAQNLVSEVVPIMQQYGFTDLNLDIESVKEASADAQIKFTSFVKEVKRRMDESRAGTVTIDISPIAFFRDYLIKPSEIINYVDRVVLMAYDYHNPASLVTGAVSPLEGAGTIAEFDTKVAVEKALAITSQEKLILGIPLYGYEWETLNNYPRAATIPGTNVIVSSQTVEKRFAECANCNKYIDNISAESYFVYKDDNTDTYHQIFYPDKNATEQKVKFAKSQNLGGIALWALGYEDSNILEPLKLNKK